MPFIIVSDKTLERLISVVRDIEKKRGQSVSYDDAIQWILDEVEA